MVVQALATESRHQNSQADIEIHFRRADHHQMMVQALNVRDGFRLGADHHRQMMVQALRRHPDRVDHNILGADHHHQMVIQAQHVSARHGQRPHRVLTTITRWW